MDLSEDSVRRKTLYYLFMISINENLKKEDNLQNVLNKTDR